MPAKLKGTVRSEFIWNRSLDKGNPHPGTIGSDFNRLGTVIWASAYRLDGRNQRRREILQELVDWRNAIAYQDFDAFGGNPTLHLSTVKSWRRSVNALAGQFDQVMCDYLHSLLGKAPW